VQYIKNLLEGSKMFFPFRSTPKKHWRPRGSRRHTDSQSCVRGSK